MVSNLRQLTSLSNLNQKGQMATVLILIMVAVLILILATANIGQFSSRATGLANAADAAALSLGSQLASRGRALAESLSGSEDNIQLKKCQKGGILATVLAIIGAIVGLYYGGMWGAALGGAIGGAIGAEIMDQNPVSGALQGAAIGIGIASGYSGVKWLPKGVAGAAIMAGASLVSSCIYQSMRADQFTAIAKSMSGLDTKDRLRESTFFSALSMSADDPTMVVDSGDVDRDGITDEQVSAFLVWWESHIQALKGQANRAVVVNLINDLLTDVLNPFQNWAEQFLALFDREEIECGCSEGEGSSINLWRTLTDYGYTDADFFWQPGPARRQLLVWYDCDSGDCVAPEGMDAVDGARMHLEEFMDYVNVLLESSAQTLNRDLNWLDFLYEPPGGVGEGGDYYALLEQIVSDDEGIGNWISQTEEVRGELPGCQLELLASPRTVYQNAEADPSCQQYAPPEQMIHPCNWTEQSQTIPSGEVILPNGICRVDTQAKTTLQDEISAVRNFIGDLEEELAGQLEDSEFAGLEFAQAGDGDIESVSINSITLSNIGLAGSTHPFGANTDLKAPGEIGTIYYSYTVDYDYTYAAVEEEEPEEPEEEEEPEPIYAQVTLGPFYYTSEDFPDLHIPPMADKDTFLAALDTFDDTLDAMDEEFATIDIDTEDEFALVLGKLEQAQGFLQTIPGQIENYYWAIQQAVGATDDSDQSITYPWGDSRGGHSVTVTISDFKIPEMKKTKHGNFLYGKTCLEVVNYTGTVSVKISRDDREDKRVGILGSWLGAELSRKAKASYSYDRVGLRGVN